MHGSLSAGTQCSMFFSLNMLTVKTHTHKNHKNAHKPSGKQRRSINSRTPPQCLKTIHCMQYISHASTCQKPDLFVPTRFSLTSCFCLHLAFPLAPLFLPFTPHPILSFLPLSFSSSSLSTLHSLMLELPKQADPCAVTIGGGRKKLPITRREPMRGRKWLVSDNCGEGRSSEK